jgi:hypothetical protein
MWIVMSPKSIVPPFTRAKATALRQVSAPASIIAGALAAACLLLTVPPEAIADERVRLGVHGTAAASRGEDLFSGTAGGLGADIGLDMNHVLTVTLGLDYLKFPDFEQVYNTGTGFQTYSTITHSTFASFGTMFYPLGNDRLGPTFEAATGLEMRNTQSTYGSSSSPGLTHDTGTTERAALLMGLGLWVPIGERTGLHVDGGLLMMSGGTLLRSEIGLGVH